jgi:hypothetical protein
MMSKGQKFYKLDQLVLSRCTADRRKKVRVNLKKEQLHRKLMKEGYNAKVPDKACATFFVRK